MKTRFLNWINRNKILKSRVAQLEQEVNHKNEIIVLAANKLVEEQSKLVKYKLMHQLKKTEKVGHN